MNWRELQSKRLKEYQNGIPGFFNTGTRGATVAGKIISKTIPGGLCLDIGCGILPLPPYMTPNVRWRGIDPLPGDYDRDFPFIIGCAENLPHNNSIFDGVLFSTSLDHVINPPGAIWEAYRVLKMGGYMFIWGGICRSNKKYKEWLAKPPPAFYDKHHLWAFTINSIKELTYQFKPIRRIILYQNPINRIKGYNKEIIFIYQKNESYIKTGRSSGIFCKAN